MNRRDFFKVVGTVLAALVMPKTVRDDSGYYMPPELPPWFVRFVKDHAKKKRITDQDSGGYLLPPEITEQLLELQKLDPADRHVYGSWKNVRWHALADDDG